MTDHADLKRAILDVSLQLGTELGEDGLTMRAIARRLGVSATALYQHFESKAAILRELRFRGIENLDQYLISAFDRTEPIARLESYATLYLRFSREHPWMYALLTQLPEDWGPGSAERREVSERTVRYVAQALMQCREQGTLREGVSFETAPLMLWASLHGVALLMSSGRLRGEHPLLPTQQDENAFIETYAKYAVRCLVTS